MSEELFEAVMDWNPSAHTDNPQYPVESVNWNLIVEDFIPKLNQMTGMTFSLPTGAQWKYAAQRNSGPAS